MYALDFEEFLWANGINENAISILKEYFISCEKIDDEINNKYLNFVNDYLVVGGIPDVVNEFINNKNYIYVHSCQQKIIDSYKDDALKYAKILTKMGINLYYYKNRNNTQEIEFIFEKDGNVVPVEVKSKNGKTISLNTFRQKFKPNIAYKIIYGNIGKNDELKTIPYYMLMFI